MTKLRYALAALLMALAAAGILLLRENIARRKAEARQTVVQVAVLSETTDDPAVWGRNFPRQHDSYRRTVDMERTRYGGSEADPSAPGREGILKTTSRIELDPRLKTLWDGYAFAIDFREERGHAYMLHDQRETERVLRRPQVGSCLHCHASVLPAYRRAGLEAGAPGALTDPLLSPNGREQLMRGFVAVSAEPYDAASRRVDSPVSCLDCHDPLSMKLRITRPALLNGLAELAASGDATPHLPSVEAWRLGDRRRAYDPNLSASVQEMRSLVCAQCHVEYFCGPKATLFFPWKKGLKAGQIEATYDETRFPDGAPFSDWKHARTGAEAVKLQHPEFELWSQGPHARAGVSCADCHMPYVREGALKISSHHVRSPLLHVNRSCQVCHKAPEEELKKRAFLVQDGTKALMDRALDAVVELIADLESARGQGVEDRRLVEAGRLQRRAQFRVDFVNAENSMGFHAPQEAARLLGEAIDFAHRGRLALVSKASLGERRKE